MDASISKGRGSASMDSPALQEKYRKLLADYNALQSNLNTTLAKIASGDCTFDQVSSNLAATKASADSIGEFINSQLHHTYFNEIKAQDSTIAQRTFAIPELLELILLQADVRSILAMMQVCKSIRSHFRTTSANLRIALFYLPDTDTTRQYRTQFGVRDTPFAPFTVSVRPRGIEATFDFSSGSSFPRVSRRWQRMLISQPPVKQMGVYRIHKYCGHLEQTPIYKIFAAQGFTVAQVLMCVDLAMREPRSYCSACVGVSFRRSLREQNKISGVVLRSWIEDDYMDFNPWDSGYQKFVMKARGGYGIESVKREEMK